MTPWLLWSAASPKERHILVVSCLNLIKASFSLFFQQTYEIGIFLFVWQDNMVIVSLVSVCMAAMALAALRRVHSTHLRSVEVANA